MYISLSSIVFSLLIVGNDLLFVLKGAITVLLIGCCIAQIVIQVNIYFRFKQKDNSNTSSLYSN